MNTRQFLRALTDSELAQVVSEARKEQRRRKKIATANNTWICNEGLREILTASIDYVSKNPG